MPLAHSLILSKEEAEKTCKSSYQRATLATLAAMEVAFVKKMVKAGLVSLKELLILAFLVQLAE